MLHYLKALWKVRSNLTTQLVLRSQLATEADSGRAAVSCGRQAIEW